jgi:L-asparaginase
VLVVSQAHHNGVDLSLYQAGTVASAHGALSGGDMTTSAALAKLMHALGTWRGPALRRYLLRDVAGERSR